ncbi:MAG: DUF6017 domain-containing protein [Clostridia bacterium]
MAECIVEKRTDFTVMSNHHFRNKNLSLKAKGLLSTMFSLNDNWDYSIVGLATLSRDGVDSVKSGIKELEQERYVKRIKRRNPKGQIVAVQYLIREFPIDDDDKEVLRLQGVDNSPRKKPRKPMNKGVSPKVENPLVENPLVGNPPEEKPLEENPPQLNTNQSSTKKSNTYLSNINQSNQRASSGNDAIRNDEYKQIQEMVYENIEYEYFKETMQIGDIEQLDEIVDIMVETLAITKDTINISGQNYAATIVKNKLLKLDSSHIEYVFSCLSANTTQVKNVRRYLLTTLFNAPSTINNYYSSMVQHDMANPKP